MLSDHFTDIVYKVTKFLYKNGKERERAKTALAKRHGKDVS